MEYRKGGRILGALIILVVLGLFLLGGTSPFNSPERPIYAGFCLLIWGFVVIISFTFPQRSFLFAGIVKWSNNPKNSLGRIGASIIGLALMLGGAAMVLLGTSKL